MDIEQEIRKTLPAQLRGNGSHPSPANEPDEASRHGFVTLGNKVAQALVQAAEDQVTLAQNKLKEIQAWADNLTQEVAAKDRELAELNDRIRDFGETVLEANRKFNAADNLTASPRDR